MSTINLSEMSEIVFNGTVLDTVIFNGVEVWSGKDYLIKDGVVIDSSKFSQINFATSSYVSTNVNGAEPSDANIELGTIVSNTLPNLSISSEYCDEEGNDSGYAIYKKIYFYGDYRNGFVIPDRKTILKIRGTITVNNVTGHKFVLLYGYNDSNVDAKYATYSGICDSNFEIEIPVKGYTSISPYWSLYAYHSDRTLNIAFSITDLYFE